MQEYSVVSNASDYAQRDDHLLHPHLSPSGYHAVPSRSSLACVAVKPWQRSALNSTTNASTSDTRLFIKGPPRPRPVVRHFVVFQSSSLVLHICVSYRSWDVLLNVLSDFTFRFRFYFACRVPCQLDHRNLKLTVQSAAGGIQSHIPSCDRSSPTDKLFLESSTLPQCARWRSERRLTAPVPMMRHQSRRPKAKLPWLPSTPAASSSNGCHRK